MIKKKTIVRNWRLRIFNLDTKTFFKVPHTSLFIKKDLMKKLNSYSLKYNISSDTDFLIRLGKLKKNFFYISENLVFMKTGGLSTSKKKILTKIFEDLRILYNHFGLFFFVIYLKKIFVKIPVFFLSKKFDQKKLHIALNYK